MKKGYRLGFLTWFAILPLHAGPGEVGRPSVIPTFEQWAGSQEERSHGFASATKESAELKIYALDGTPLVLKDLWKSKPLLLVHSSLTCPISRDNCPHVDRIKEVYGDKIEVVVLYTTEAHPVGSPSPYSEGGKLEWITDRNIKEDILVDEPATLAARLERAREYQEQRGIKSRILVDGMTNEVWKAFGGGPNTGIFIDTKGHVIARQGWLKPSVMTGEIRSHFANINRREVNENADRLNLKIDLWTLSPDEISRAAEKIPGVLTYNVNTKGASNDETLLHLAAAKGNMEVASLLLKLGAPPDLIDRDGLTPLDYLLKKEPSESTDALIKLLLENKASLTSRSDKLESATHFAVQSGTLAHVKLAIEAGAPLDAYSIDGISPLHEALFRNDEPIARYLLSKGASEDIFAAAALGDDEQVKRFLTVRPEAWNSFQGDSGRTPLMYAAINGKTEMVQFLLSRQSKTQTYSNEQLVACLKQCNDHDRNPAALAIAAYALPPTGKLAPPKTQSLVPQAPPQPGFYIYGDPVFHEAAQKNNSALLTALMTRGWDIDALNPDEETALHHAAQYGAIESIALLLKHGADIEAKSGEPRAVPCGPPGPQRKNRTPLHLAVISLQPDAVEALVKAGANLNYSDLDGKTPLSYALPQRYLSEEHAEQLIKLKRIVKILIKAGADPNKPSDCGKTFKELAGEIVEKEIRVNDEWQKLGNVPLSPELLEFVSQLEKE